jgi:uncharacterized membrane protein YsdA (DUF1294 family)
MARAAFYKSSFWGLAAAAFIAVPLSLRYQVSFLLSALLAINLVTFVLYAFDKLMAWRGRWRVPETTLHLFCFIGGSPAAFIGQRLFRHKITKDSFRRVFWILVVLQVALVLTGLWLWRR